MRQAIAVLSVVGLAGAASANDFTGAYDPANWTVTDFAGGSVVLNATTATLTSGDISIAGDTTLTILAAASGTFSFDWEYFSSDSGAFDSGGYIADGSAVELAINADSPASGSVSVGVTAGLEMGFYVTTVDGIFGPGTLTISNFRGPIPAPGAAALLGLGGLALVRRRR